MNSSFRITTEKRETIPLILGCSVGESLLVCGSRPFHCYLSASFWPETSIGCLAACSVRQQRQHGKPRVRRSSLTVGARMGLNYLRPEHSASSGRKSYVLGSKKQDTRLTVDEPTDVGGKLLLSPRNSRVVQNMNYSEYINSDQWRAKRLQYLRWRFGYRTRWHCENCPSKEPIEVHHKTYDHLGDEKMIELIALCRSCHSIAHESGDVKFEFHTYRTRAEAKEKIQRSKEGIVRKQLKKLRRQDYADYREKVRKQRAKTYLWNTPNRPTGGFIEFQGRLIYDIRTR